jgi:hypothetical protein
MYDTFDILSGPKTRMNDTDLNANSEYYPIYGLFIVQNEVQIKILNDKINKKESVPNNTLYYKLHDFIHDYSFLREFYEKSWNEENLYQTLQGLLNIFPHKSKKPTKEEMVKYHFIKKSLVKRIDFYSFGIILLKYINKLSLVDSGLASIIKPLIYDFLKETSLLDQAPLQGTIILDLNIDEINQKFKDLCKQIIDIVEDYEATSNKPPPPPPESNNNNN